MDAIEGTVVKTRFRSPDSGFTVMIASVSRERHEVSVVGVLAAEIEKGVNFSASGRWDHNSKFGRQFKFEALTVLPPSTEEQVVARLKTYPGIKDVMARRIVERFGGQTWTVLDERPEDLADVRGIGAKALDKIRAHHAAQHGPVAKIQARLIEFGASPKLAASIHEEFGGRALDVLEQHPYQVAARVDRFGFKLAEKIARLAGLDPECEERVDAGILHALAEQYGRGHCGMPPIDLTETAVRLLGLRTEVVDLGLARLVTSGALRYQRGDQDHASLIFTRRMDWTEETIAHAVGMLATAEHDEWDVGELPDALSDGQREAVSAVCRHGLTILTGGPGTGKSTVVANVLAVAERMGTDVILCAPTGRAAKRLGEATARDASTIHRLLGVIPGTMEFSHDKTNPLRPGLLVIDEASMLDARLAESLLSALTPRHRVMIVGDVDQLPSVGPGNVLRDIIEASSEHGEQVPVVRLTEVFRQAAGSPIIANAHRILAGDVLEPDPLSAGRDGQFFVLRASTPDQVHAKIVTMASESIPAAYGLDRLTDVQILCPMHKGPMGTDALNQTLQSIYTAPTGGEGFGVRGRTFFVGDRVMQTKNDYGRNVFNGDIGTVIDTDADSGEIDGPVMIVDFDGTIAEYGRQDLGPLRLAYAMTIHKSQGSEFPAVLIPMTLSHRIMLRRNLLYTAITRAKRLCVLVGDPRAIRLAIDTADASRRWTGLRRRILAALGNDR